MLRIHYHVACRVAEDENSEVESMLYAKSRKQACAMLGGGGLPTPALLLKLHEYKPRPDSTIKWLQPIFFIRVSPVLLDMHFRGIWLTIMI